MVSKLGSIFRQATKTQDGKLNVLCYLAHERYQSMISDTGHEFYCLNTKNSVKWNKDYNEVPKNFHFIDYIPIDLDFDLILCPANRYAIEARQIAAAYCLPLLHLEVFVPDVNPNSLNFIRKATEGDVNVFIDDYSRRIWNWKKDDNYDIIKHGIDPNTFSPAKKKKVILSCVNDWIKRDWSHGFSIWKEVTDGLPTKVLGNTPGLSKAVPFDEMLKHMGEAGIYLNTTIAVPVPTALLEAMSCGCAVVALNTGGIDQLIEHGKDGFLANNIDELKECLRVLLDDTILQEKVGKAAREKVIANFNIKDFVSNWDRVIRKTANTPYTGNLYAN